MAKGKKKDPSKKQPVSEEQPSTSSQATAEPEEDEGGLGLDLGGGRKKKKQKAAQEKQAEAQAKPEPAPVAAPAAVPASEPKVEEVAAMEEEFEGLGLSTGGKKKPRKKKKADSGASGDSQPSAAAPAPAQPSEAQVPQAGVVPPSQSTPAPGQWGQRAQQPPPGQGTAPGQRSQPAQQIPPGQSTPAPGQWGQRAQQPPPGQGTAPGQWSQPAQQIPPSQSTPAPGQWGQPAQNFPPSRSVPQTQPSAGRGRGRGETSQPLPGASTDRGQSAQYRPSPPPQQQPSAARPTSQYAPAMEQGAVMCRYKVPKKIPGGVIRARPVDVITNYLPMTIKALKISRYDVTFKPDRPKKLIPVAFKQVKNKYYPNEVIAFDQMKNCYSLRPLSNVPKNDRFTTTTDVQDINGKVIKYEVSFKETGLVDLGKILSYMATGGTSLNPPTEEIQCVDVILRQGTLEAYIKAGRQFFQRPAKPIDLGDGLEMWTGLFQSAIFTSRSFINIDVAHKGFPKQQPLIDAMSRDFRLDLNRPVEQQYGRGAENFVMFIKGLRVVTTLVGQAQSSGQKREFICNGLVDPPTHMTFLIKDEASGKERKITVAEYFAKEKQYRIRYPKLNCVWVGHRDKNIYFPMELLQVSYGQPINKQLNETQLANMVREAATPPDERLRKISQVISHMNYPKNEQFRKFGLEISDQFFSVKGKVLDAPSLEVGEGRVIPRKGAWQANKLLKPEALQSWGFIAIETDPRCDYENVISMLMNSGRTMGMAVSEPRLRLFDAKMQSLHNILFTALEKEIKFLFIIVPTRGRDYYHKVKQMAERDIGILTQCIKEFTASRKMNPMTARNILLKVNSKLMGINQALDGRSLPRCLKDGGVMIVGADVTHPSPDQTSIPSIAAVTASIDPKCYMYNIELSIQTPKKEMIVEFEDMMVDHFKIYKQNNQNYMPRKIFVFRDGVSEGQFAQVMNSELQAVHNAYRRMAGANAKPEILFLLVQKRHHTRFFLPKNTQYNVEPGTVVDREIVHASELDFYLVSHQAIKGTARPTRYHAVCNDGAIPDDEVEQLTYYLCHLYSRCMRAVSYPTPTYYAHLACLRARSLTHGEKFDNKELEKSPKRLRVLDKMLQYSRMFFV